jgi:uncharacterized protein (TIGR02996 family)
MEHPDWPAFMAAIVADPDDDTVRLAAADFLEEHGEADRAAFIRIQVELARLEAAGEGKSLEVDHLRAKERAFLGPLSMYRALWAAEECPELVKLGLGARDGGRNSLETMSVDGAHRLTWHRGFVEAVTCPFSEWLLHGSHVRSKQPVREVVLIRCETLSLDVAWPLLPTLKGLRRLGFDVVPTSMLGWFQRWLPGVEVSALATL